MKSLKKQAIKSVTFNYLGYFFHALISIIATPIIVHSLGNAQYGIWSLVISVTGYYGLLNFGMRSALTKYLAEYNAKGDFDEVNRLINSSFVFFTGIAATILVFSYIVSINFHRIFVIEDVNLEVIRAIIIITGLNISLSFIFQPFDRILVALNRFDIRNIIGIGSSIVRVLLIVAVLKAGFALMAMAFVVLFVDVATYIIISVYSRKIFKKLSLGFTLVTKRSLKKLFNFGLFNFMRHLSEVSLRRADSVIIGIFLGPSMIAIYTIAEGLINYMWLIAKGITTVTLPVTSSLAALNEVDKLRKVMLIIPKYILPIALFIGIQFYFLGDEFILLWMGEGYHQTYVVFCILMIARFGMMSHETMIASAVGMGHNKFVGFLAISEILAKVLLSIYLVKIIGLIGVALGTVIPLTISRSLIIPVYCCGLVGVKLRAYLITIIWPSVISLPPSILATFFLKATFEPTTYFGLFVNAGIAFIVMAAFFYRYLDPEIKLIIKEATGITSAKEISQKTPI